MADLLFATYLFVYRMPPVVGFSFDQLEVQPIGLMFFQSTDPFVIWFIAKKRGAPIKTLTRIFHQGELPEFTQGPFKGLSGLCIKISEKLTFMMAMNGISATVIDADILTLGA